MEPYRRMQQLTTKPIFSSQPLESVYIHQSGYNSSWIIKRERIIHGGKIMPVFLVIESKQTQKSEER